MAEPKKRGLFGLPSLVVIGIGVAFLLIFILAILVGPIGQGLMTSLFGEAIEFPDWMVVPQPVPHLPAPEIFNLFGWSITNSMIGAWLTVVFLVVISFVVTRRMKLVPGRLQGLFEALLGWMYDFVVGISGDANARRFFPVICTIFLFVLFNAWLSLLPGFVSVEYKRHEPDQQFQPVKYGRYHPRHQERDDEDQYLARRHIPEETEGKTDQADPETEPFQQADESVNHPGEQVHQIELAPEHAPDSAEQRPEVKILLEPSGAQAFHAHEQRVKHRNHGNRQRGIDIRIGAADEFFCFQQVELTVFQGNLRRPVFLINQGMRFIVNQRIFPAVLLIYNNGGIFRDGFVPLVFH